MTTDEPNGIEESSEPFTDEIEKYLVHGTNLATKTSGNRKYSGKHHQQMLREILARYQTWRETNDQLQGPRTKAADTDEETVAERVKAFIDYKDFLDQQKYAEAFDSRSNLHSSVLEEFIYYLFRDLVSDISINALIGKSHTFKDLFFSSSSYAEMLAQPNLTVEKKDHDFVIGVYVETKLTTQGGASQTEKLELPAVAIECKTYLDKTMLESASRSADQLKARNPNALYIVVMEWIKLTNDINLRKYEVDQIYVLRKQKNTDREFRYEDDYEKNPIHPDVVWHLFSLVRDHLTTEWQGTVEDGMKRGWLM